MHPGPLMLACAVALAHGVSTRGQVPKRISGNNCYRYPDGREITLIKEKKTVLLEKIYRI